MEYTVRSSHGELTIDKDGYVIECQKDNNNTDGGSHLALITRFDLVEWRRFWSDQNQTEIDILDLGYWYNDPKTSTSVYVAPDADWRKEVAEILLQRKRADRIRAGAPELLEILSGIIPDFEPYVAGEADSEIKERNEAWIAQARAVIAKAEGK